MDEKKNSPPSPTFKPRIGARKIGLAKQEKPSITPNPLFNRFISKKNDQQ